MKGARNLLLGLVLGGIMGWALGYLRLPFVDHAYAFWVGFAACVAAAVLFMMLRFILVKKGTLKTTVLLAACLIIGAVGGLIFLNKPNPLQTQTDSLTKRIQDQSVLIDSLEGINRSALLSNVLDKLDDELKGNAVGILSEGTIARVVALSKYLKPYVIGDSLSDYALSPERGQLLLTLCAMEIDSTSFAKIKREATFASATLQGANLNGADLSSADLRKANMRDAQLVGANMRDCDLRSTILWGANATGADMSRANMRRIDIRWAVLNDALLKDGNLEGAVANNVQLMGADLRNASFRFADFSGAMLNGADMRNGILFGMKFIKTNLTKADLSNTILRTSDFSKAIMDTVNLENAEVEKNWFQMLEDVETVGTKYIMNSYEAKEDSLNPVKFRLYKKNK